VKQVHAIRSAGLMLVGQLRHACVAGRGLGSAHASMDLVRRAVRNIGGHGERGYEVLQLLLDAGAVVDPARLPNRPLPRPAIDDDGGDGDGGDDEYGEGGHDSVLHIAAQLADARAVRMLVAAGAPLEVRDPNGWTPVFWAEEPGTLRAFALAGAHMDAVDTGGWTILHWLVVHNPACTVVALDAGCNPNAVDGSGNTPIMYTTEDESPVIPQLLAAGARCDIVNPAGLRALHHLSMNGFERGVNLALARPDCDPCATTVDGNTAADLVGTVPMGRALSVQQVLAHVRAARARGERVRWRDDPLPEDGGGGGGAALPAFMPPRHIMRVWVAIRAAQLPRLAWQRRAAVVVGAAGGWLHHDDGGAQ